MAAAPARDGVLLHLWSNDRNVVRRIVRIVANEPGRLALDAIRFGRARAMRLELVYQAEQQAADNATRQDFPGRFCELVGQQFPDEKITSLTNSPDLKHSLSGNYARGVLESGTSAWAVLGAAPGESAATYDALLSSALACCGLTLRAARHGERVSPDCACSSLPAADR